MNIEQAVLLFFLVPILFTTFTLAAGLPNILGCKETDLTENDQFDRVYLFLLFIMGGLLLYIELHPELYVK
jgi:hypothetical protein